MVPRAGGVDESDCVGGGDGWATTGRALGAGLAVTEPPSVVAGPFGTQPMSNSAAITLWRMASFYHMPGVRGASRAALAPDPVRR